MKTRLIFILSLASVSFFSATIFMTHTQAANLNFPSGSVGANGNMGIGIAPTTYKLDVGGSIHVSGGYVFSDGTVQSTAAVSATNPVTTAGNVSVGTFGSNTGGGAYVFSSNVTASQFNGSGAGLTGTAGSLTAGFAGILNSPDGDRNAATKLPTTNGHAVRFDFVGAATANGGGNYSGLMTYAPFDGTSASTGDASYQIAFDSPSANGGGVPYLSLRSGINSTWNTWYTLLNSGNYGNYALPLSGGNVTGVVNVSGNVGIGTTAPNSVLDVRGQITSGDGTLKNVLSYISGIGVIGTVTNNDEQFYTNGSAKMTIQAGGNVGIGTTGPSYKLDVAGQIRSSSGGYIFPDGTTQATAATSATNPVTIAANVAAGNFGANTGGGNYNFPGGIATAGYTANSTDIATWSAAVHGALSVGTGNAGAVLAGDIGASHNLWVTGTVNAAGLTFSTANPTISASSYITFPGGGYFNSGTLYAEAAIQARGGIHDDTHANLTISGGTSGNTSVPGTLSVGTSANVSLAGDIGTSRNASPATGVIYLGSGGSHYLYFDGSTYFLNAGGLNVGGNLTIGGNKLTVGTIDPVYSIDGTKYATYSASMTGVNEESAGTLTLALGADGKYEKTIDFGAQATGSDLWLFSHATDLKDNVAKLVVILTPSFDGKAWYTKDAANGAITIYSDHAGEVSYRFTAPRFDSAKWLNTAPAGEDVSFTVK